MAFRSMNNYRGPFPEGVPNPFTPMLHSYPTRYHGPIYTRPMYELPGIERPYDFVVPYGQAGLGEEAVLSAADAMPPAWKWAVALGLASVVVLAGMHFGGRKASR